MKKISFLALPLLIVNSLFVACSDDYNAPSQPPPAGPSATVISATGDIAAKVNEFRTLIGDPANGGTAGQQPGGRRQINWDGAGANPFNNQNNFPADFFNTNVKAGAVFTTTGVGFRNDTTLFRDLNPTYPIEFSFFSPNRTFAPVGSNIIDVNFRVAGSPTPAVVSGFGVVVSDVDRANVTSIEFFDAANASLGRYYAPVRSDAKGLSFVGAKFDAVVAARVRITLGDGALGVGVNDVSSGGTLDLVVTDDFIYGEPAAF
jgi:hypothetical protein